MNEVMQSDQDLPATMISPETGKVLTRGVRPFVVTYQGESLTVELPGYYPADEGSGIHVGNDNDVVEEALRTLKITIRDD